MINDSDLIAILALQQVRKIGDTTAKKLIAACGSAKSVLDEKPHTLAKIDGVGTVIAQYLKHVDFSSAEDELRFIKDNNIQYWYFTDNDYPENLKHCIDGPVLLFGTGNIDIKHKPIISIVGTRQITVNGKSFCEELVETLAPYNPIVVSGFAYGTDITAQKAAIDNGLQTIGCLAHGLNQIYPKPHKRYVSRVEENGGFITDFWSTANPDRENFLKRNRIIAGLSQATIVIESAEKGGSLVTADIANSYNREVFAVPGRVTDSQSSGCNNLIKHQQAHMLTTPLDIPYMLNWELETEGKPIQKQLFVELENEEKTVYHFLKSNGRELLDGIALNCNMPTFKVAGILLNMELKGVVRPLPGKWFEII